MEPKRVSSQACVRTGRVFDLMMSHSVCSSLNIAPFFLSLCLVKPNHIAEQSVWTETETGLLLVIVKIIILVIIIKQATKQGGLMQVPLYPVNHHFG